MEKDPLKDTSNICIATQQQISEVDSLSNYNEQNWISVDGIISKVGNLCSNIASEAKTDMPGNLLVKCEGEGTENRMPKTDTITVTSVIQQGSTSDLQAFAIKDSNETQVTNDLINVPIVKAQWREEDVSTDKNLSGSIQSTSDTICNFSDKGQEYSTQPECAPEIKEEHVNTGQNNLNEVIIIQQEGNSASEPVKIDERGKENINDDDDVIIVEKESIENNYTDLQEKDREYSTLTLVKSESAPQMKEKHMETDLNNLNEVIIIEQEGKSQSVPVEIDERGKENIKVIVDDDDDDDIIIEKEIIENNYTISDLQEKGREYSTHTVVKAESAPKLNRKHMKTDLNNLNEVIIIEQEEKSQSVPVKIDERGKENIKDIDVIIEKKAHARIGFEEREKENIHVDEVALLERKSAPVEIARKKQGKENISRVLPPLDAQENADNNNPEWQVLKKLETDEERYKAVRMRWRNLIIPDPNKNLTYINIKNKENQPFLPVSFKDKKSRKRTCSEAGISDADKPTVKHARTQSCTLPFDLKFKELMKTKAEKERQLRMEKNQTFVWCRQEWNRLLQSNLRHYNYHEYMLQVAQVRYKESQALAQASSTYSQAMDALQAENQSKLQVLKKAMKEVKNFHQFYQKLDSSSESAKCNFLTDDEMGDIFEQDKLYERFKNFYQ